MAISGAREGRGGGNVRKVLHEDRKGLAPWQNTHSRDLRTLPRWAGFACTCVSSLPGPKMPRRNLWRADSRVVPTLKRSLCTGVTPASNAPLFVWMRPVTRSQPLEYGNGDTMCDYVAYIVTWVSPRASLMLALRSKWLLGRSTGWGTEGGPSWQPETNPQPHSPHRTKCHQQPHEPWWGSSPMSALNDPTALTDRLIADLWHAQADEWGPDS